MAFLFVAKGGLEATLERLVNLNLVLYSDI